MSENEKIILVIDDETAILKTIELNLVKKGYTVITAISAPEGLRTMDERVVHAVLVDYRMPGMNGLDFLEKAKTRYPEVPVIIITAFGTIEMAVEAMRKGAFSYLTKPPNFREILQLIEEATEEKSFIDRGKSRQDSGDQKFENIITENRKMEAVLEKARNVALTDASVLISGETGTGKELVAKAIHAKSPRADQPFISINCAALPDSLLESELFGHVRGAFTGAWKNRKGRFEAAEGGTLFLDEIGDMQLSTQGKLLRVLQEMEFERVGSSQTVKVDVRIIAATNRDLQDDILHGNFREDLYFRLNVIPVNIPPLRDRKDDIALLANYFFEKFCEKHRKNSDVISTGSMTQLLEYDWPGNVRELENSIERAVILSKEGSLEASNFNFFECGESRLFPKSERELIVELEEKYADSSNTLTMIAREMKIDPSTLYRKRKKYGLL